MIPALTFADPTEESAYQLEQARVWLGTYRAGSVLLPLLFASFAVVDLTGAEGAALWRLLALRALTTTLLAAFVPVWFSERLRPRVEANLRSLLLAEGVVALVGLLSLGAVLVWDTGQVWLEASTTGLLVALSFLYGGARLPFRLAVTLALATSLAALALLASSPADDPVFATTGVVYAAVTNALGAYVAWTLEHDSREAFRRQREVDGARARTERLLHTVLHPEISARMRHTAGRTFAETHPCVTVILADVAGFTPLCQRLALDELGAFLDTLFGRFDELCDHHGALKIKTLGDAWLAVAGLPHPRDDHARCAAELAREMVDAIRQIRARTGLPVGLRIGVATGPAVAGVIGRTRYAYDVWGPAVRDAAAMEQGGAVDRIRVDDDTAAALDPAWVVRDDDGRCWLTEA